MEEKKITKKEAFTRISKMNLPEEYISVIAKDYERHRKGRVSVDQALKLKEIHEGTKKRECSFLFKYSELKHWGIYRIDFSHGKFYIGRSKNISARMSKHKKEIDKFFETGTFIEEHYLIKVFEHLRLNILDNYYPVKMIEQCYSLAELQQKEQKWFNKYKDSPNCLNRNFIATIHDNEIEETPEQYKERKANVGVRLAAGRLLFYAKDKSKVIDRRSESFIKTTPEKKKSANEFSFDIPEIDSIGLPTVFKLYCGDKYIIHKGKTLGGAIFHIQRACGYFIAYNHNKLTEYDQKYYQAFYEYVFKHRDKKFHVEVVLSSEDAYQILVTEQLSLNAAIKDKNCLNNNLNGYVPVLNAKTGIHGWITVDQVNRFYDFLSSL